MSADYITAIALITWGGTRYYAVEVLERTPAKTRVSLTHSLGPEMLKTPSGRIHHRGGTFLVPKDAIRYVKADKLERDLYEGRVYGYGGTIDARR